MNFDFIIQIKIKTCNRYIYKYNILYFKCTYLRIFLDIFVWNCFVEAVRVKDITLSAHQPMDNRSLMESFIKHFGNYECKITPAYARKQQIIDTSTNQSQLMLHYNTSQIVNNPHNNKDWAKNEQLGRNIARTICHHFSVFPGCLHFFCILYNALVKKLVLCKRLDLWKKIKKIWDFLIT